MNIKVALCIIGLLITALPSNVFAQQGGACCFPTGNCTPVNDQFDCLEGGAGYTYMGDGTTCDPNPCQLAQTTPIPTMNEWGMIIFMVLAGLGSVYYLRRQRRT